ncbi:C4-dicarboxylate TRAP transporter substrate-binding protein [Scandinavium manionii]|uniref:C4-dicarboxylate TRAP transporter substrate-binding protein n=1 Tax=Scandinavium manionii TaxID=2926520 RepID=UPI00216582CD|nr:C4-dicarboxylate TRAP transporter substrate-binding protein [Scandinavium manionii]MCS2167526.1 C4-dicarboxylate TRAP transporter substrate-binding protein [Scandinavium manionii]
MNRLTLKIKYTAKVLCFIPLLCAGGSWGAESLNVSTSLSPDDPVYKGLQSFKKDVESGTHGEIKIKLFSSGQLGADNELLQHAQAGSNVAVVVDGARLAQFVPEFAILPAPFVFKNYDALKRFINSPIFVQWNEKLTAEAGLTALSFNWYQGARMLITQKPVTKPADLSGVRVRALEAPVTIETIKCLGGSPTPLSWSEIYSSIQTGVVDAAEAQPTAIYGSKLYEITKYITRTEHIHLMTGIIVSQKWLATLSAENQKILKEAASKNGELASENTINVGEKMLQEMASKGMTVSKVDVQPFIDACKYVPEKMGLSAAQKQVNSIIN